jgi:hypothetical protein
LASDAKLQRIIKKIGWKLFSSTEPLAIRIVGVIGRKPLIWQ